MYNTHLVSNLKMHRAFPNYEGLNGINMKVLYIFPRQTVYQEDTRRDVTDNLHVMTQQNERD